MDDPCLTDFTMVSLKLYLCPANTKTFKLFDSESWWLAVQNAIMGKKCQSAMFSQFRRTRKWDKSCNDFVTFVIVSNVQRDYQTFVIVLFILNIYLFDYRVFWYNFPI